jgi:hypothetical protein
MDNYIGKVDAEWVDPVVELPEQGHGIIVRNSDGGVSLAEWHNSPWPMGRWVAWLRIGGPSDAIPREAVQAAVDEMDRIAYLVGTHPKALRGMHLKRWQDLSIMQQLTGVTPSVAEEPSVAQEAPHA